MQWGAGSPQRGVIVITRGAEVGLKCARSIKPKCIRENQIEIVSHYLRMIRRALQIGLRRFDDLRMISHSRLDHPTGLFSIWLEMSSSEIRKIGRKRKKVLWKCLCKYVLFNFGNLNFSDITWEIYRLMYLFLALRYRVSYIILFSQRFQYFAAMDRPHCKN